MFRIVNPYAKLEEVLGFSIIQSHQFIAISVAK